MPSTKRETNLTDEVMAYFSDPEAHFAPSQIDWAMGLRKGMAHDIIVRKWGIDKAEHLERVSDSYERKRNG